MKASFWARVDVRTPEDCWPWRGAMKGPYGQLTYDGRNRSAHAVAWELHHGRSIVGYGLHSCHNPVCCNPAHVYPGTQSQNIRTSVEIKTHRNARKTHCVRGHEFTEENTYRKPGRPQARQCLICIRARKGK